MTDGVPFLVNFVSGWRLIVRLGFGVDPAAAPFTGLLTDVSTFILQSANVTITRGAVDELHDAPPGRATFTLKNLDGRFSMRRANSPYWPYVKAGIPCQISVIDPSLVEHERFAGYVTDLNPSIDETGKLALMVITAQGIAERDEVGEYSLDSALTRSLSRQPTCYAYWPCEDQASTTGLLASTLAGVAALQLVGADYGSDDALVGSLALPALTATSSLAATIPDIPDGTSWQVCWFYNFPTAPATDTILAQIQTPGGTASTWQIIASVTTLTIRGLASDGTVVDTVSFGPGSDTFGGWISSRLYMSASGGTVTWHYDTFLATGVLSGSGTGARTYAGTVGQPRRFLVPADTDIAGMAIGHIAVFSNIPSFDLDSPARAYTGEDAITRQIRLCAEEGLVYSSGGVLTSGQKMGPQTPSPLNTLLQEATDVDGGLLEDCVAFGYLMHPNSTRYNASAALTIARTTLQIPADPTENFYTIRNRWVVSRTGGGSATYTQTVGPYTPTGPGGIGIIADTKDLNLADDTTQHNRAAWLTHLSTLDDDRYTQLTVYLHKQTAQIAAWVGLQFAQRILTTGTSSLGATFPIDVRVYGWTETLSQFVYTAVANTGPNTAYNALTVNPLLGVNDHARIGSNTAVLAAGAAAAATSLSVATPAINGWTGYGSDYPQQLAVHGQAVTALMRGAILNANPYFVTNATGWTGKNGASVARSTVRFFDDPAALQITPDGVTANPYAEADKVPVVVGRPYNISARMLLPSAPGTVRIGVAWYTAAGAAISLVDLGDMSLAASYWGPYNGTLTAPATATQAGVYVQLRGTPASSVQWYADNIYLSDPGDQVSDDFADRTAASGWGSDRFANAWTVATTPADFAVAAGVATITTSAATVDRAITVPAAKAMHAVLHAGTITTPSGGIARVGIIASYTDASNYYIGYLEVATTGQTTAVIAKKVASTITVLASQLLPYQSYPSYDLTTADVWCSLVTTVVGSSLQLDFRAWSQQGNREPYGPTVTVTDAALTQTTTVGVYVRRNGTAPTVFTLKRFAVVSPQKITIDGTTLLYAANLGDGVDSYPPMTITL